MTNSRMAVLGAVLSLLAISSHAESDGPEQVRPSAGTVATLRKASTEVADTLGKRLDAGHDWLYRQLQRWLEKIDLRFGAPDEAPIVVPLSPVRIGFDAQFLHGQDGFDFRGTRDLQASLALPNIERRLKLFVTSSDLQETSVDPAAGLDRAAVARFAQEVSRGPVFWYRHNGIGRPGHRRKNLFRAHTARSVAVTHAGDHLQFPKRPRDGFCHTRRGSHHFVLADSVALADDGR